MENNIVEVRQFSCNFAELAILQAELEIIMGFHPGGSPEPFPGIITAALSEARGLFEVKTGYRRIHPVTFMRKTWQIGVSGQVFSPGKIIFNELENSVEVAFFTGTAGEMVSRRCHELNKEGETIYSYVLDVLGSMVVDKAVEKMVDRLEEEVSAQDWHVSEPYSPGYCDWNVAEQQKLFSFFPAGFCGITLSTSSLMSPLKSVSGIIGIGPRQKRNNYKCSMCSDKNCFYSRIRDRMVL